MNSRIQTVGPATEKAKCGTVSWRWLMTWSYSTEVIHENQALSGKFLQFGIVLAIGMLVSKTTAYRLWWPLGGRCAQNPIWPHLALSQLVALYLCFGYQGILIWNYFVVWNLLNSQSHVKRQYYTQKLSQKDVVKRRRVMEVHGEVQCLTQSSGSPSHRNSFIDDWPQRCIQRWLLV